MSLHINKFIDSVKAHESRGQKDFIMSMREAKDLHGDITKLLLILDQLRNQTAQQSTQKDEVVQVEIAGGSFKN
jgi:hypothetical protein